jgi:predicted DNA-binding transcriptional regulator AlpA
MSQHQKIYMNRSEPLQTKIDRLLTQKEAAERVRRPPATLRFWRVKGIGPKSANVGGRVLYKESDVEAWIAEQFAKESA